MESCGGLPTRLQACQAAPQGEHFQPTEETYMATSNVQVMAKRVKGGSFLTEERDPQDVFTPEDLSEEHRQIAKTAIDFTQNEVMPAAAEIEAKNFVVTKGLLRKAGELGLMCVDIPEAYGGLEMDKVTSALIAESISKLASFSVAFSAHVGIGTLPIVWYGTEEQKRKYLPKLGTGEWIGVEIKLKFLVAAPKPVGRGEGQMIIRRLDDAIAQPRCRGADLHKLLGKVGQEL